MYLQENYGRIIEMISLIWHRVQIGTELDHGIVILYVTKIQKHMMDHINTKKIWIVKSSSKTNNKYVIIIIQVLIQFTYFFKKW